MSASGPSSGRLRVVSRDRRHPSKPVLPPGTYPIIGPELATYGVVQPIARQMGLTTLGTLHERLRRQTQRV